MLLDAHFVISKIPNDFVFAHMLAYWLTIFSVCSYS